MEPRDRIYLDNAATSWPKPETVYEAVDRYLRTVGAPAGRGVYAEASEADRLVRDGRRLAAELLDAESPDRVVFTLNATDSLNFALRGLLQSGDHVVTTTAEHNSVLRPLRYLEEQQGIEVTRVAVDQAGRVDLEALRAALKRKTRLVALNHGSNVTGAIQPAAQVAQLAHEQGALLLLDAAQTLGHLPISVQQSGVDLLAAAGHKGLMGPLGTGLLYVRPGLENEIVPLRMGGTGTVSDDDHQPTSMPDRFESGNANLPGIVGLRAGLLYLRQRTIEGLAEHQNALTQRLLGGLQALEPITVWGPGIDEDRLGVVSISVEGYDPQEFSVLLDATAGIQVRPGFHCAPLLHRTLGTDTSGGLVRFSVGAFNTLTEVDVALATVRQLVGLPEED